jgi:hypothetical protein
MSLTYFDLICSDTMDTVRDVLGKFGKKVGEAAKKTEDLAGNMWQHCKPDFILNLFVPSRIMDNSAKGIAGKWIS